MLPKIDLRQRIKIATWANHLDTVEGVFKKVVDLASAPGWLKVVHLPNLFMETFYGMTEGSIENVLQREGWVNNGWVDTVPHLLIQALEQSNIPFETFSESKSNTERSIYYPSVGCLIYRMRTSYDDQCTIWRSDDGRLETFFGDWCDKNLTGILRFPKEKSGKRAVTKARRLDEHPHIELVSQKLETHPMVAGSWCPTLEDVREAVLKKPTLLHGPTGTGKTESVIQALSLGGKSVKILVIPGNYFHSMETSCLDDLISVLNIEAIIIDDLDEHLTTQILEDLTVLKEKKIPLAITVMTSVGESVKLHGLRPGRIDKFFAYGIPNQDDIQMLLTMYHPDYDWTPYREIIDEMTPAFIKEIAYRVKEGDDPLKAIASVNAQYKIVS